MSTCLFVFKKKWRKNVWKKYINVQGLFAQQWLNSVVRSVGAEGPWTSTRNPWKLTRTVPKSLYKYPATNGAQAVVCLDWTVRPCKNDQKWMNQWTPSKKGVWSKTVRTCQCCQQEKLSEQPGASDFGQFAPASRAWDSWIINKVSFPRYDLLYKHVPPVCCET